MEMNAVAVSQQDGIVDSAQPTKYSQVSKKDNINTDIKWSNVNFSVGKKQILDKTWGHVPTGKIAAIMGPSGSGKSSLLNVLAGRSSPAPGIDISGMITVAGKEINPVTFRRNIAYVMQDDALMATATPREALEFSARLRLPSTTTSEEIKALVDQTLTDLGLNDCSDVMIGGPLIKGISGGQRKRTSVGVEIITNPTLLFLDEPTSGLDSFSAFNCIQLLKQIALNNSAVLCTIHQPSSEVFFLFDIVIFMKEGRILYHGAVNTMVKYFSARGFECPENYNPSDYIMFVNQTVTTADLEAKGLFAKSDEMSIEDGYDQERERTSSIEGIKLEGDLIPVASASFGEQLKWLTYRETLNTKRDIGALIGRFGITIFLNLLYGLIFLNCGGKDDTVTSNLQSHFGGLTFIMISAMFGAAQPIMLMFPFERPMFMREYSTGTYSAFAYFLSKVILEFPLTLAQSCCQFILVYYMMNLNGRWIYLMLEAWALGLASSSVAMALGASVSNVKDVTELAPLLFVPQLLFAGFFIRTSQIPVFLRWAQYLCGIKYTMNLALLTEFDPDLKSCQGEAAAMCESVINSNDINADKWWVYLLLLGALFVGFRLLASIILVHKAKRFY